jgi:hypothetical protein
MSHDAMLALETVCNDYGLPHHYKSDLEHDRTYLDGDPSPVFGWVVYDCGTHIIDPCATDENGRSFLESFRGVLQTCFTTDRLCYVWEGSELRAMASADDMIDWLEEWREVNS